MGLRRSQFHLNLREKS